MRQREHLPEPPSQLPAPLIMSWRELTPGTRIDSAAGKLEVRRITTDGRLALRSIDFHLNPAMAPKRGELRVMILLGAVWSVTSVYANSLHLRLEPDLDVADAEDAPGAILTVA